MASHRNFISTHGNTNTYCEGWTKPINQHFITSTFDTENCTNTSVSNFVLCTVAAPTLMLCIESVYSSLPPGETEIFIVIPVDLDFGVSEPVRGLPDLPSTKALAVNQSYPVT